MKGIIRIGAVEVRELLDTVGNSLIYETIRFKVKRIVGSLAFSRYSAPFIYYGSRVFTVHYIIVSCTYLDWTRLKENLSGRYIRKDKWLNSHKRKQAGAISDVDFYVVKELENELFDLYTTEMSNKKVLFNLNNSGYLFYYPYEKFVIDSSEIGTLILQTERRWYREGGPRKWKRRIPWKMENGNYKSVDV